MRKLLFFLIAIAAAAAAPAQAPTGVSIAVGESVVVRLGTDGAATVESRSPAPAMAAYDAHAVRDLVATPTPPAGTIAPAVSVGDDAARAAPPTADRLRLTFRTVEGKTPHDSVLTVENGYDKALVYHAVMRRGDRSAATDVCLVMPGKRGYEHWPFQLDRIDLSAFQLVPWKEGDPIPCS